MKKAILIMTHIVALSGLQGAPEIEAETKTLQPPEFYQKQVALLEEKINNAQHLIDTGAQGTAMTPKMLTTIEQKLQATLANNIKALNEAKANLKEAQALKAEKTTPPAEKSGVLQQAKKEGRAIGETVSSQAVSGLKTFQQQAKDTLQAISERASSQASKILEVVQQARQEADVKERRKAGEFLKELVQEGRAELEKTKVKAQVDIEKQNVLTLEKNAEEYLPHLDRRIQETQQMIERINKKAGDTTELKNTLKTLEGEKVTIQSRLATAKAQLKTAELRLNPMQAIEATAAALAEKPSILQQAKKRISSIGEEISEQAKSALEAVQKTGQNLQDKMTAQKAKLQELSTQSPDPAAEKLQYKPISEKQIKLGEAREAIGRATTRAEQAAKRGVEVVVTKAREAGAKAKKAIGRR